MTEIGFNYRENNITASTSSETDIVIKCGIYFRFIKRPMDIILSLLAIIALSPVLLTVAILVWINLGLPIIYKQKRPGKKDNDGNEKIFTLYKFRTMTNERDENGNLLPDEVRLTYFGKRLRYKSLDELPELFNILNGDMSVIGPRPQLVRDMVFMTDHQRMRHNVCPGLSGLAQINGRNGIEWDDKLKYDLKYIQRITFLSDWKIIFITIRKVLQSESISYEGMATAEDYGDYLLRTKKVSLFEYNNRLNYYVDLLDSCKQTVC